MVGFLRACTSLSFTVTTQPTPYERHANTERKMGVELAKRGIKSERERESTNAWLKHNEEARGRDEKDARMFF